MPKVRVSPPPRRPHAPHPNPASPRPGRPARQIPGLSLAIIQGGKIVEARAYGVIEKGGTTPVTPATLFQAEGKLPLDGNVNEVLTSWKVPENAFTAAKPVTLRGILSHTAGLSVPGFPGYAMDQPVATLVQVLDGSDPANTAPIRVDTTPGSIWRYSGGGYTVMQQMIVDLTRRRYPDFMRETVLEPFGMTSCTFEQPLPPEKAAITAAGHYANRRVVEGRWKSIPKWPPRGSGPRRATWRGSPSGYSGLWRESRAP